MAEFQEVMAQAKRMCEANDFCEDCSIPGVCIFGISNQDIDKIEERIMKWAKDHPEPVYPTWGEWFHKTFPKGNIGCFSPCAFYDDCDSCKRCGGCNDLYYDTPIPAYIAEKLGIKPKEAGK